MQLLLRIERYILKSTYSVSSSYFRTYQNSYGGDFKGAFSSHYYKHFTIPSESSTTNSEPQKIELSLSKSDLNDAVENMRSDLMRLIEENSLPHLPHPVLKAVIRQFGSFKPRADQVMIIHGPKGVGKRTAVEEMVSEWDSLPHAVAYVNFENAYLTNWKHSLSPWTPTQYTKSSENSNNDDLHSLSNLVLDHSEYTPIHSLDSKKEDEKFVNDRVKFLKTRKGVDDSAYDDLHSNAQREVDLITVVKNVNSEEKEEESDYFGYDSLRAGVCDLDILRNYLEGELEALAIEGIRLKKLNSEIIYSCLTLNHSIDDILSIILKQKFNITPISFTTENESQTLKLWNQTLGLWSIKHCTLNYKSANRMFESYKTVQHNYVSFENLHWDSGLDQIYDFDSETEKSLKSLSLVKQVFQILETFRSREKPKKNFGGSWKSHAKSAVLWPSFLVEIISDAAEENVFQPKLIINGFHMLKKAEIFKNDKKYSYDGNAYHDCFLSRLIIRAVNEKSLPVILISSDSYYSHYLHNDFGTEIVFEPYETFGWMPEEMDIHLQNSIFNQNQWGVVSGVLGSNIRHLTEFYAIWKSKYSNINAKSEAEELELIENCLDEYITFLQVTEVEPAMDTALKLIEKWAVNASKGKFPFWEMSWGVAWRNPPKIQKFSTSGNILNQQMRLNQWSRFQMINLLEAMASTQFAANYATAAGTELLEDPVIQALLNVGILYMQRNPPIVRPTTRAFQRCLTRWLVREKLHLTSMEKLKYFWLNLHKGRSYRHLMTR